MSYRYVTNTELANWIRSGSRVGKDLAIVDVRDSDFRGGNIVGAINEPSEERTEESVRALVRKLEGEARGPKAARIYVQELERQLNQRQLSASSATGAEDPKAHGEGQSFSPNPFRPPTSSVQEVLVLRGGFTEFQRLFSDDPKLVENWDRRLWTGSGGFTY